MDERSSPYWLNFLYYFNVERDFFACHEHGEYWWLNTGRPECLKGLIQVAISFYHLGRGNLTGSQLMRARGIQYLRASDPVWEGVDLAKLVADTERFYEQAGQTFAVTKEEIAVRAPRLHVREPELARALHTWKPVPLPEEE
jgi:predicted metal-dependent hydrolase